MKHFTKPLVLMAALALGACGSNTLFDDGAGPAASGDASNPNSPLYFQQTVGDRILFEVDQSTLTPQAQGVLDGQAQWLIANPSFTSVIEGHADEQGTREYNLALGARRANAVQEYLLQRGIAGNRMQVVSYGKERPIQICSDETCYSQNRRSVTDLSSLPSS